MQRLLWVGAALAIFGAADAAQGEGLLFGAKNRTGLFDLQTSLNNTHAAAQIASENSEAAWHGGYTSPYLDMAREAARRNGVPEDLFLRLVQQESSWRVNAKSRAGAYGLTQLMPRTARALGVDRTDPYQNLDGGAQYLRLQYNRFRSWPLALAAYNAGPTAVAKHNGMPPFPETRRYVRNVWGS